MTVIELFSKPWGALTQPGQDPSIVLASACQLAAVALSAWLCLTLLALMIGAVPGAMGRCAKRCARALTPLLLQRLAATLIGLITAAGPGQAWAVSGSDLPAPGQPAVQAPSAPITAAPVDPSLGAPGADTRPQRAQPHTVVVKPGDTLWDLAKTALGPDGTDARTAHSWPHWWHDNRPVIGPDPNLLRPGQVLNVPEQSR